MNHTPKFRYYKLEGANLDLLRAYKTALEAMVEDRVNLEKEFTERAKSQSDHHRANIRVMWRRLAASVGLDPDTTWGNPEYQIEARYLDDGFGAVLYAPNMVNPLLELLGVGGEPGDTPEDPALAIPPKSTTRH